MAKKKKHWLEQPKLPPIGNFVYIVPTAVKGVSYDRVRVRFFENQIEYVGDNFTLCLDKRSLKNRPERKYLVDAFLKYRNDEDLLLISEDSYLELVEGRWDWNNNPNLLNRPEFTETTLETPILIGKVPATMDKQLEAQPAEQPEEPMASRKTEPVPQPELDINVVIAKLLDQAEKDRDTIADLKAQLEVMSREKADLETKNRQLQDDLDLARLEIEELKLNPPAPPAPRLSDDNANRFRSLFPEGTQP